MEDVRPALTEGSVIRWEALTDRRVLTGRMIRVVRLAQFDSIRWMPVPTERIEGIGGLCYCHISFEFPLLCAGVRCYSISAAG